MPFPVAIKNLTTIPKSSCLINQERISLYRPGGYHPVCLGDTFNDKRYTVIHKLGWGGFSTVWLARDVLLENWVALKICTADVQLPSRELSNIELIQQQCDGAGNYSTQVLDSFVHKGPNGSHQCIVTELLGPTLFDIISYSYEARERLDSEDIFKITRQLLRAIASLHRAGVAHGDLNSGNIVFKVSGLNDLPQHELLSIIQPPYPVQVVRTDGTPLDASIPKQIVPHARWMEWAEEDGQDIRLIDWDQAFKHGMEPGRLAQPVESKAPETMLSDHFDYRVDLWRAGCIIYELIFASHPFRAGDDCALIAQMIGFVESLPQEWMQRWGLIQEYSTRRLNIPPHFLDDSKVPKLESHFASLAGAPELRALLPVIRGLMRFLPWERLSADEALEMLPRLDESDNGSCFARL